MTAPTTAPESRSTAPLAWVVALTLAAGLALVVVLAAFSQSNTDMSIDGDKATYSHWLDEE